MATNPYDDTAAALFGGQLAIGARSSIAQVSDRNPDAEAQVQGHARQLGVPYESARAHPQLIQKQIAPQAVDYDHLARTAPRTARFLSSTSNAAIAHDDVGVLGQIEHGLRYALNPISLFSDIGARVAKQTADQTAQDVRQKGGRMPFLQHLLHTDIGAPLKAGLGNLATGALGALEGSQEAAEKVDVTAGMQRRLFGGTLESGFAGLSRAARRKVDQRVYYQPADTQLGRDIQSGLESIPLSLGALATTIATDGVAPGLAMIGATTYGQSYGQARDQGFGVGRSTAKSAIDAVVEMATEYLPEKWFLSDAHAHAALGRMLIDQFNSEVPGEQVATLLQDFNQWAMLDQNRGKSFDQYASEIAPHAASTMVATGVGLGAVYGAGAAARGAKHGAKVAGRGALYVAKAPVNAVLDFIERIAGAPLPPGDPAQMAVRGSANAEYAPVFDALRNLRRAAIRRKLDPDQRAQQVQALADAHAQKKPALEEQQAQALAELPAAEEAHQQALDAEKQARKKASEIRTRLKYAPDTATASDLDSAEQQQAVAEEQATETADALSTTNRAAAGALMALQTHAFVEQHIKAHIGAGIREQAEAEHRVRNIQRRLAQKELTAQQAQPAAQHIEDIGKLAAASKLRGRNPGPGVGSFHDLVAEMAEGSPAATVYVAPGVLAAILTGE